MDIVVDGNLLVLQLVLRVTRDAAQPWRQAAVSLSHLSSRTLDEDKQTSTARLFVCSRDRYGFQGVARKKKRGTCFLQPAQPARHGKAAGAA